MNEPYRPTVNSQAGLQEVWTRLMGPWGFGGRSLWLLRLVPVGTVVPAIAEISDCDEDPDPESVHGLGLLLTDLDADFPGGSFAFLISRPGSSTITDADRSWAHALLEGGRVAGVDLAPLHLATDAGTRPLPPDELIARRSA
jgi:hypothetical protein